jgi:hypothetical protein
MEKTEKAKLSHNQALCFVIPSTSFMKLVKSPISKKTLLKHNAFVMRMDI